MVFLTIENVLKDLLGSYFSKVSQFSLDFIKRNQNEDGVRITFEYLKKLDIKIEKIAKNAQLLGMNPETIQRNYNNLIDLEIKPGQIARQTHLLRRKPETIIRNYNNLLNLKIAPLKISTNASLLGMNPKTIQNYEKKNR